MGVALCSFHCYRLTPVEMAFTGSVENCLNQWLSFTSISLLNRPSSPIDNLKFHRRNHSKTGNNMTLSITITAIILVLTILSLISNRRMKAKDK